MLSQRVGPGTGSLCRMLLLSTSKYKSLMFIVKACIVGAVFEVKEDSHGHSEKKILAAYCSALTELPGRAACGGEGRLLVQEALPELVCRRDAPLAGRLPVGHDLYATCWHCSGYCLRLGSGAFTR